VPGRGGARPDGTAGYGIFFRPYGILAAGTSGPAHADNRLNFLGFISQSPFMPFLEFNLTKFIILVNLVNMKAHAPIPGSPRKDAILAAAIAVFGRYGYRKATVDDLAKAAGISKPGFYLHYAGKQEVFIAAIQKYLADGLQLAQAALDDPRTPLSARLMAALDAWFGRHQATFAPESFDVLEASPAMFGMARDQYKEAFQAKIARAIADSPEYARQAAAAAPADIARVLFLCGLTWKELPLSRQVFLDNMRTCIAVCCPFASAEDPQ